MTATDCRFLRAMNKDNKMTRDQILNDILETLTNEEEIQVAESHSELVTEIIALVDFSIVVTFEHEARAFSMIRIPIG